MFKMKEIRTHLCADGSKKKKKLIMEWSEINITELNAFR